MQIFTDKCKFNCCLLFEKDMLGDCYLPHICVKPLVTSNARQVKTQKVVSWHDGIKFFV